VTPYTDPEARKLGWLFWKSGPLAGARHPLRGDVTRIGRAPDNDIVVEEAGISAHHLEIRRQNEGYRLEDLGSTNGTWVRGVQVTAMILSGSEVIRLGTQGPEVVFAVGEVPADADPTLVVPPKPTPKLPPLAKTAPVMRTSDEDQLSAAVARARAMRGRGEGNLTMVLMRGVLEAALHRSGRRFKRVIAGLVLALAAVSGYGAWRIHGLKREKTDIDSQIQELETALSQGNQNDAETDKLVERLNQYQDRARALQQDVFYRIGARGQAEEDPLRRAIRSLMREFGAEIYSIPPEFYENVNRYIQQYRGPDRPHMERALGEAKRDLDVMQAVFREEQLPPDLVFLALAESAFLSESVSREGAVGLWQFTPRTARAYGLRVGHGVDERKDIRKATRAASKYIRELILEFGSGSSVMLALAAYNLGPGQVKQGMRRTVTNPIKQRDFWYLYRTRALPSETREYVPRVIAAMLIGRSPAQFGF
jgi:pSer/pThr/pTyr-binding forkhead associated (FHA) protein/soluble lytic murein transglycosylase-like protein